MFLFYFLFFRFYHLSIPIFDLGGDTELSCWAKIHELEELLNSKVDFVLFCTGDEFLI